MQTQSKTYSQLIQSQRYQIGALRKAKKSQRDIARIVGVSASAVCRELNRNEKGNAYDPESAQKIASARKSNARKATKITSQHIELIKEKFKNVSERSLANLSSSLRLTQSPLALSTSSLYRCIAIDKARGGKLYTLLPFHRHYKKPGGKRKIAGATCIPERVDIDERPAIVEKRNRLGDWEGDLVCGPNGYLVTLVDRQSRYLLSKKVFDKTKETVARAIIQLLNGVEYKHTITLDNGGEFALHKHITEKTGIAVYFAKPYCSWQRGTNENMNGWIRRFYPKKTRLGSIANSEIAKMVLLLNNAPRSVLGGMTPSDVFYQ